MDSERDDYLWDPSAPADPEVERLERLLGRYRAQPREWSESAELLPEEDSEVLDLPSGRGRRMRRAAAWATLAAAAAFALFQVLNRGALPSAYEVEGLAGRARAGVGERIQTPAGSTARLVVADLGHVRLEPDSILRVDSIADELHRLHLERGRIHAEISARPRRFQVGTPAGLTIDLGCEYDLEVDPRGVSRMTVAVGRVAFQAEGREVVAPAGTWCEVVPGERPSTPLRVGAPRELGDFVRAIEAAEDVTPEQLRAASEIDLLEDGATMWNLFVNTPSVELRDALLARLARSYPRPSGVDEAALRARDPAALEAWVQIVRRDWRWR